MAENLEITDTEQLVRCAYCGKTRVASETKKAEIWRNGRVTETFCADDDCAACAQMSAEG